LARGLFDPTQRNIAKMITWIFNASAVFVLNYDYRAYVTPLNFQDSHDQSSLSDAWYNDHFCVLSFGILPYKVGYLGTVAENLKLS